MTIEQIDETRVLIALGQDDMRLLSLEYETLSFKDPYSRRILKKLLKLAGARTGVPFSRQRVFVEALPYDKGCLLVLTFIPKEDAPKRYYIKKDAPKALYCFEDAEALLGASEQLYRGGFLLTGSTALTYNHRYYLYVDQGVRVPQKALFILREYALSETREKNKIAKVFEHGTIISKKHPVLTIGSAMCK